STSKRLFTIMDLSTVWIQAQVYEKDLADVLKTEKAVFSLDALPGETFEGRIKTVSPVVNETTRTVDVLFDAPNPKMKLRVGMAVKVPMQTGKPHPSLTIPASALLEDEGRPAVYVAISPDEFVRRDVQVGMRAQGRVEVKSGLVPGESVVVQG